MNAAQAATRFTFVVLVATSGCALAGHTSSPWEWGGGVRVAPGWALGSSGLTGHPMASYTYLSFDGGHDTLWELGGQIRKPLGTSGRSLWLGAEAAGSYLSTVLDAGEGAEYSDGTTGFSLTALAGLPVGQSRWGLNLYAGAGVSNYGSTGINIRAGIDLQPWFLSR